jgi:hypothetical protein
MRHTEGNPMNTNTDGVSDISAESGPLLDAQVVPGTTGYSLGAMQAAHKRGYAEGAAAERARLTASLLAMADKAHADRTYERRDTLRAAAYMLDNSALRGYGKTLVAHPSIAARPLE